MEIQTRYKIKFFGHALFGDGAKKTLPCASATPPEPVWRNGEVHFRGTDINLKWPHWSACGFDLYFQEYVECYGKEFAQKAVLFKTYFHPDVVVHTTKEVLEGGFGHILMSNVKNVKTDGVYEVPGIGMEFLPSTPWEVLTVEKERV